MNTDLFLNPEEQKILAMSLKKLYNKTGKMQYFMLILALDAHTNIR